MIYSVYQEHPVSKVVMKSRTYKNKDDFMDAMQEIAELAEEGKIDKICIDFIHK